MGTPPRDTHELSRRLAAKKHDHHGTRNAAILVTLVLVGLLLAAVFFGAKDPLKIMSAATENLFTRKIVYNGDLKESDLRLPPDQLARLNAALELYTQKVKQILIWAEKQDSYAPMKPDTILRFQVTVVTHKGEQIKCVMTRTTQGEFVDKILWRLKEDASRYMDFKKGHEQDTIRTFINTM